MNYPIHMTAVLVATAILLAATPVFAEVAMTIVNHSSQSVMGINSFPLDEDGEVIEDNLGGTIDEVPPGGDSQVRARRLLRSCLVPGAPGASG